MKIVKKYKLLLLLVPVLIIAVSVVAYVYKNSNNARVSDETEAEAVKLEIPSEPVSNQMVVKLDEGVSAKAKADFIKSLGLGVEVEEIAALNSLVVKYPEGFDIAKIEDAKVVAKNEPDYMVVALEEEDKEGKKVEINDPEFSKQWAFEKFEIAKTWENGGSDGKIIAIVDSGICFDHPDLKNKFTQGKDFVNTDDIAEDEFGHGCGVAGVIGANIDNKIGIAGANKGAKLMPVKVLDKNGTGTYSNVTQGIVYATDNGANIINLSLGGSSESSVLEEAVSYATNKGVLVVAAAGNTGTEGALYPAKYEEVIAVGSVNKDLRKSSFSNFGKDVDVWAPGGNIYSTLLDGGYGYKSGTSFAAPFVSSVIAYDSNLDNIGLFLSVTSEEPQEAHVHEEESGEVSAQYSSVVYNNARVIVKPPCNRSSSHVRFHQSDPWGSAGYADDLGQSSDCANSDVIASISGNIRKWTESLFCYATNSDVVNTVMEIENVDGIKVTYRHHNNYTETTNDGYVDEGEVIATIGNEGCSVGAHIHFEVYGKDTNDAYQKLSYNQWDYFYGSAATDKIILFKDSNSKGLGYQLNDINSLAIHTLPGWIDNNASSILVGNNACAYVYILPRDDMSLPSNPAAQSEEEWGNQGPWQWFGSSREDLRGLMWRETYLDQTAGQPPYLSIEVNNNISTLVTGRKCLSSTSLGANETSVLETTCFNGPDGGTTPPPTGGDNADFIADVTIPDDTDVAPNQSFTKTWRMQNNGTTTWTTSYRLQFQYGTQMGAPSSVGLSSSVAPGANVDISVNMIAPSSTGSYGGNWKMVNGSGTAFGDLVWVDIDVVNNAPPVGGGSMKLFPLANYQGTATTFGKGKSDAPSANTYSLELSSGWSVKTYSQDGQTGEERCWYESVPNLQDHNWQNKIQSIEVFDYNVCGGNSRVKLYSEANYGGAKLGEYSLGFTNDPNRDSFSMEVPTGWSVKTWDEDDKRGRSRCWSGSVSNFQDHESWHLDVASLEVFSSNVCPSTDSFVKLCKITGAHEGSDCTTIPSDIPSLGNWGFGNDTARSLWIQGGWEVILYEHDNYEGTSYKYTASQNDISGRPANNVFPKPHDYGTSSIKLRRTEFPKVTLYSLGDFAGEPFRSDRSLDNLGYWGWDNRAQSFRIDDASYEAIFCEHPNMKGICARMKASDPNRDHIGKAFDFPGIGTYLQGKVSSYATCQNECGNPPEVPVMMDPLSGVRYTPGTSLPFRWSGSGDEFLVEISGGALSGSINSGWIKANTWSTSTLPASAQPYQWRVKAWNSFGEGAWSSWSNFYVQDVAASDVYIFGPQLAELHTDYTFTSYVNPADATNLAYNWSPAPKSGQGTGQAVYNWNSAGAKTVTLTVSNSGGNVARTYNMEVGCGDNEYITEYFTNKTLTGAPAKTECESEINHNWGDGKFIDQGLANFGTGRDGDLVVPAGQTVYTDSVRTHLGANANAGGNTLLLATPSGFAVGDEVMIIQVKDTSSTAVGRYEFGTVNAINGNTVYLTAPLQNNYRHESQYWVQIIKVPHYNNVTVDGTLTANEWNNFTGGVLMMRVKGSLVVNSTGKIDMKGKGYRGYYITFGGGGQQQATGEGHYMDPVRSREQLYGGGGGGLNESGDNAYNMRGSGGGGHATPGTNSASGYGLGGTTFGNANLKTTLTMGGAGGVGGDHWRIATGNKQNSKAMNGGGVINIYANTIMTYGSITADGENGYPWDQCQFCVGAGGAGGSVYLVGKSVNTNVNMVSAVGGNNFGSRDDTSGDGGLGRIQVDYCSTSAGNSNPPPAVSNQINCYDDNMSARWTGKLNLTEDDYMFNLMSDDGSRLWIDGEQKINEWTEGVHNALANTHLASGLHDVKVEYYENTGNAYVNMSVTPGSNEAPVVSQIPYQIKGKNETFDPINLSNYVTDAENDPITWTYSTSGMLQVSIVNGIATVTKSSNWIGQESVAFTATDRWGQQSNIIYVVFKIEECPVGKYFMEVFPNNSMTGTPSGSACVDSIDQNWGAEAPNEISPFQIGDGRDGVLNISGDVTDNPIDSVATATAGTNTINATNPAFAAGQTVMIIESRGGAAGKYEFNEIASYSNGVITTVKPMLDTYTTSTADDRAQVLVVKQYTNVNIPVGAVFRAKDWNGQTGGVLVFFANGEVKIDGSIIATGTGYRGGSQTNAPQGQHYGNRGEGTGGDRDFRTYVANGNGGGGGQEYNNNGGAGGGYGTAGANGTANVAQGGYAVGVSQLPHIYFGGAGGGAAAGGGGMENGLAGGDGGGIIYVQSKKFTNNGSIVSDGSNGGIDSRHFGGGAGAGGTIYVKSQQPVFGTMSARGGVGGGNRAGGAGGVGRIKIVSCGGLSNFAYPGAQTEIVSCNSDNFSVKFNGTIHFAAGNYAFTSKADDGIRLVIDAIPVFDSWTEGYKENTTIVSLTEGVHYISVQYNDLAGDAQIKVTNELVLNTAPQITAIPMQETNEDVLFTSFDLDDYLVDPDVDDTHVWSFGNNSQIGIIISAENVVTTTLPENWNGEETVTFTVTDGKGASANTQVLFKVNPVNDSPVIGSQPVVQGIANNLYSYDIEASDVDSETLTYSLTQSPQGMQIDAQTGMVSWTPTMGQVGEHSIIARVSDGTIEVEHSYTLTITPDPTLVVTEINEKFDEYSGWTEDTSGGFEVSHSSSALKIQTTENTGIVKQISSKLVDVEIGKTYYLAFNAKTVNADQARVMVNLYDNETNLIGVAKTQVGPAGNKDWTEYRTSYSIPATFLTKDVVYAKVVLQAGDRYSATNMAPAETWFDDVYFSQNGRPYAVWTYSPAILIDGSTLTLDGSTSADPDGNTALTYSWQKIDGPEVTINGSDQPSASIALPSADKDYNITLQLKVNDSLVEGLPIQKVVNVKAVQDQLQEEFVNDNIWTNLTPSTLTTSITADGTYNMRTNTASVQNFAMSSYVAVSAQPYTLTYRVKTEQANSVVMRIYSYDASFNNTKTTPCAASGMNGTKDWKVINCSIDFTASPTTKYISIRAEFAGKVANGQTWIDYIRLNPVAPPPPPVQPTWKEISTGSASGNGLSTSSLRGIESDNNNPVLGWIDSNPVGSDVQKFNGTSWVGVGGDGSKGGFVIRGTDGVLYTGWEEPSPTGDNEIYVKKFDGTNWVTLTGAPEPEGISNNTGNSVAPRIGLDPNNKPFVIWHDNSNGNWEIYVRYFNGSAWMEVGGTSATGGGISNNSSDSYITDIVVNSAGVAYAAWENVHSGGKDVYMKKFDGTNWVDVSTDSSSGYGISGNGQGGFRSLAIDSNSVVYATWIDYKAQGSTEDVYVKKLVGSTWSEVGAGSASGGGISNNGTTYGHHDVAIGPDNTPYITWAESNSGNFEIYVKKFNGTAWVEVGSGAGSGTGISNTSTFSQSSFVEVMNDGTVVVAWYEEVSGQQRVYAKWYK